MPDAKKLARFEVVPSDQEGEAQITIEADDGTRMELIATVEQLDVMADALDDLLVEVEEADDAG